MRNGDDDSQSINLAGQAFSTGIENKDNDSPSINVAGHGPILINIVLQLVCKTAKMLCRALV